MIAERIAEAVRIHAGERREGSGAVLLRRGSRPAHEWLASLRAVGDGATDYRTGIIPVDELERVLSDTSSPDDVRIGAAVALRVADGETGIARIRVAAEVTAGTSLRRLLMDIAEEPDEENLARHLRRAPP